MWLMGWMLLFLSFIWAPESCQNPNLTCQINYNPKQIQELLIPSWSLPLWWSRGVGWVNMLPVSRHLIGLSWAVQDRKAARQRREKSVKKSSSKTKQQLEFHCEKWPNLKNKETVRRHDVTLSATAQYLYQLQTGLDARWTYQLYVSVQWIFPKSFSKIHPVGHEELC